jgi:hypothetical protein
MRAGKEADLEAEKIPSDTTEIETDCSEMQAGKVRLRSLGDLDRRTAAHRRTAELIERIEVDLGGADRLSTAQRQVIRRAALLGAMLEDQGMRWLSGEPIDMAMFCNMTSTEKRLFEAIGMKRVPKPVPTLQDYIASKSKAG